MKYTVLFLTLISFNTYGQNVHSNVTNDMRPEVQYCYGKAMIGYDSVINSHLGVFPEHIIDVTDSVVERKVMLGAYLWKDKAHEYAIDTFATCIIGDL